MSTGLLGWATSALTSLKDTVVAPFSGGGAAQEPEPAPVLRKPQIPYHSLTAKQRRARKAAARRAAARKAAAAKGQRAESGTDEGPEEEDTAAAVLSVEEAGEPAEEVDPFAPRPPTPAEEARRAKMQAKYEERQRRRAQEAARREELLAKSVVREMPADPFADEREATFKSLEEELARIPNLSALVKDDPQAVLTQFGQTQRALDALHDLTNDRIKEWNAKVPRMTGLRTSSTEYRAEIQEFELSKEVNEAELTRRVNELTNIISLENQRAFQKRLRDFQEKLIAQKQLNAEAIAAARVNEAVGRAVSRLRAIVGEEAAGQISPSTVIKNTIDLSPQALELLFAQQQIARRVERVFGVVLEQSRPPSASRNAQPTFTKTAVVWGLPGNVKEAIEWLSEADFTGRFSQTFDRRIMGSIVGRGGAKIHAREKQFKVMISTDKTKVTLYGTEEAAKKVWADIENDSETQQLVNGPVTRTIEAESSLVGALQVAHKPRLQVIEAECDVRIVPSSRPQQGNPRIAIRGRQDKIDDAVAKVNAIIDELSVIPFEASARSLSKLMAPPRNPSMRGTLNEEFVALRDAHQVFVDRPARSEQTAADEVVGISVVCPTRSVETVREQMQDLLARASYIQEQVPVNRMQLRILTAESRSLIEQEAGGKVRITAVMGNNRGAAESGADASAADSNSAFVGVLGSPESIEKGKQALRAFLEREGIVHEYKFSDPDLISQLLSNRGAGVRSMEAATGASISVDRAANTAWIVGSQQAIDKALAELKTAADAIAQAKENQEILIIDIDSNRVAQLVGRQGCNIREVRAIPGLTTVEIPEAAVSQGPVTSIKLTGQKEALDAAQELVEHYVGVTSSNDNNRPGSMSAAEAGIFDQVTTIGSGRAGRGRGRGRTIGRRPSFTGGVEEQEANAAPAAPAPASGTTTANSQLPLGMRIQEEFPDLCRQ